MGNLPTLLEVIDARRRIQRHIVRTPLHHYPSLDQLIGAEVYVKHENHQLLGSFKMRGALNVVSQLTDREKKLGVICASTGNFGQGVAYAANQFGVSAVVVMPEDSNIDKIDSMRRLGADTLFHGKDFDDAREYAEQLSRDKGYAYVHSANDPGLVLGVGTYSLEIMEDLPDVEAIIVPVGGGSGVCGACVVSKALNPDVQVYGVQSSAANAAYLSWKQGQIIQSTMGTGAEGLATRSGYEYTQAIMRELMDDFILVSEEELDRAVILHLENSHNLTEHAGAASLAGALQIKEKLTGKKIALVMSGGNITVDQLQDLLNRYRS